MTFTHEDANARLLDLVYGEAAPDVRAALETHIATCARCTADLAALGDTRALLRAGLDDADPPVPARAHAAILAAAAAAVAPAAAQPARAAVAPGPSLWERLRGKWTLPTFATVGAVAVVVIASKVFLEPERTAERGREVVGAAPPIAATAPPERRVPPAPEGAPAADKAPAEPAQHRLDPNALGGVAQDAIDRSRFHGAHSGLLGVSSSAARLARARQDAPSGSDGFGALGGLQGLGSGGGASAARGAGTGAAAPSATRPAPAMRKRSVSPAADEDLAQDDLRAPSEIRSAEKAEAPAVAPRGGFAPPPSGWKGGASASAPAAEESAAAPGALAKKKAVAAEAAEADAPASNAAPAKSAAPSAQPAPKDAEKERKQDEGGAPSQETLARRADQLYATRHWSEAILAYRELLRRYPDADLTPRWRARITQAEVASESDGAKTASRAKAAAKPAPQTGKETGKAAAKAPAELEPVPAQ
jgi:hypothetical protein